MHNEVARKEKLLGRKLEQIRNQHSLPEDLLSLLDAVAHEQVKARYTAIVVPPQELTASNEVLKGKALVSRDEFPYDEKQAAFLFGQFIEMLPKDEGPLGEAGGVIRDALKDGSLDLAFLFERVLADDEAFFSAWAERTHGAPQALYFLAFAAMSPSLAAAADELADYLPDAASWPAGTCPLCGGLPLISRLKDKEGVRLATCSFCTHEYRVPRLACAICGENDVHKLTYFTVEEEPGIRVDVCASCKTYTKTIDFREMDRAVMPAFDDLGSMALDFVAREQGYTRPTLSAWGF